MEESRTPWTAPEAIGDDREFEGAMRPGRLGEFQGQTRLKEQLAIFVEAARQRREALDHVLLVGPPGLGKTTLAGILAEEMGAGFTGTAGPVIDRAGDLVGLLSSLGAGHVLFIDEIHRLSPAVEEYLYSAMEDFFIDVVIDKGPGARSVRLDLPRFTLVGATTRTGLLTAPMRARFGLTLRLEYYPARELADVIARSAGILGLELEPGAIREIAGRSRGTPRISNRLLRRVRDVAQVRGEAVITESVTADALTLMEVDEAGLDEMDRKLLRTIAEKFGGGPVGISTLSAAIGEEAETLEDVYEPFLVQQGLLDRTPRGRCVTARGYRHLGLSAPTVRPEQGRIFDDGETPA